MPTTSACRSCLDDDAHPAPKSSAVPEARGGGVARSVATLIAVLALLLGGVTTVQAQLDAETPWPKFGQGLRNAGQSPAGTDGLTWTQEIGTRASAPIVGQDGRIYFVDPENGLLRRALSSTLGLLGLGGSSSETRQSPPVTYGSLVLVARRDADTGVSLVAVRAEDLSTAFTVTENLPATAVDSVSSPTVDANGFAYFTVLDGGAGTLYAVDLGAQQVAWSRPLGEGGFVSSPTVREDGTLFVSGSDGIVYRVGNPASLDPAVEPFYNTESDSVSTPALTSEGRLYVTTGGSPDTDPVPALHVVGPDGSRLQRTEGPGGWLTAPVVAPDEERLFAVARGDALYAFTADGERIWNESLDSAVRVLPALSANRVYVFDSQLRVFDYQGNQRWATSLARPQPLGSALALAADQTVYATARNEDTGVLQSIEGPRPVIDSTPAFAKTEVGSSTSGTVTVADTGDVGFDYTTTISGGSGAFSVVSGASGFVEVGNTQAIEVAFNPSSPGRYSATLEINTDGGTRTVSLDATTPLQVTGTDPAANATIATDGTLQLTFTEPIGSGVTASDIAVRGSQTGPIGGTVSGAGTTTLTYDPARSFAPGEQVRVAVLPGVSDTQGDTLGVAYRYALTAAAEAGPGTFPLARTVSNAASGARAVAAGYLEGPGDTTLDLVVTKTADDEVAVYYGDGTGGFTLGATVAQGIGFARPVALADVDNDGLTDIVVGAGASESSDADGDRIRYYPNRNDEGGGFGGGQDVAPGGGSADDVRALDVADLDGDGDEDVAAVTQDNSAVLVYLNGVDEDGTFSRVDVSGSANDPRALRIGDVDGNGTPDLIVGSVSGDQVVWYPNDGTGTFGAAQTIASGATNPRDVDVADFDGDGQLDVLAALRGEDATAGDGQVVWYDSTSTGWTANTIATADSVQTAVPADIDGDGDMDVVAGSVNGDTLAWYANDGTGTFGPAQVFRRGFDDVQGLSVGDFDGDGTLDPVAASFGEDAVELYPNVEALRLTGTTPSANALSVDTSLAAITATFNKPLDDAEVGPARIRVHGDQSGTFPEADGTVGVSGNTLTYELARDFQPGEEVEVTIGRTIGDEDGVSLDTARTFRFTAQSGFGSGAFADAGYGLTGVERASTAWGDYDGDGDLDLVVVGDGSTGPVAVLYNNDVENGGGFTPVGAGLTGVTQGEAAWGDYDGDGDPDLAIVGYDGSARTATIYENDVVNGNGFSAIGAGLTGVRFGSVDWGDYDQDGDQDLVVTGLAGTPTATIYENDVANGNGFNAIGAGLTGVSESAADWGDYDGDGDLDLIVIGKNSFGNGTTTVYENDVANGNGFTDSGIGLSGVSQGDAEWGDYDRDGDQDLFIVGSAGSSSIASQLFRNDLAQGNGFTSVAASGDIEPVQSSSADWGDYDGDGDLDLLVTGSNTAGTETTTIYENDVANGNGFNGIGAGLTPVDQGDTDWGDYDGDGTLDVAAVGFDGNAATATIYQQTQSPKPVAAPADSVNIHFARLNGQVDPRGQTTEAFVTFGPASGTNRAVASVGTLTGSGDQAVQLVTPDTLRPNTTYEYRISAVTSVDSVASEVVTFTTAPPRLYVDAAADPGNTGVDAWSNAVPSLQDALSLAQAGDTLWVAGGTYTPDAANLTSIADGRRDTSFVLKDGLHLFGGFSGTESRRADRDIGANPTILSGDVNGDGTPSGNSYHVVFSPPGVTQATRLDGFTITGGNANDGSVDTNGDGLADGADGGGLYLLSDSDFGPSSPVVVRTTFAGNQATGRGGAVALTSGDGNLQPLLYNVTFRDNAASQGGALAVNSQSTTSSVSPRIANAVFLNNAASSGAGEGGAVHVAAASGGVSVRAATSTFTDNTATAGGAVYVDASASTNGLTLTESILAGNTAGSTPSQVVADGRTVFANSLVAGSGGSRSWDAAYGTDNGGNIDGQPLFVDPAAGDVRLNWASPAIDRAAAPPADRADVDLDGDVGELLPVDRAGASRTIGRTTDIGAYEGGAEPTGNRLYVDRSAGQDTSTYGGAWGTPYRTLQAALDAARNAARTSTTGDDFGAIWVAEGTYRPDEGPARIPGGRAQSFRLAPGAAIYGGFQNGQTLSQRNPDPATNNTVLSGELGVQADTSDNSYHVVQVRAGQSDVTNAVLDGFTITRGNAQSEPEDPNALVLKSGGGLLLTASGGRETSPTLRNLRIQGNYAGNGAGLYAGALGTQEGRGTARPRIVNVDLVGNVAGNASGVGGGAVLVGSDGTMQPYLANVRLLGNEGAQGAALALATLQGGVTEAVLANLVASGNVAPADSATVLIRNGTNGTLQPRFVNTTFARNEVPVGNEATSAVLDVRGATTGDAMLEVQFRNSILWGNNTGQLVTGLSGAIQVDNSVVEGGWGGPGSGNVDADPRYLNPSGPDGTAGTVDDSLRVLGNSPALDRGASSLLPADAADLDGDGDTGETLPQALAGAPRTLARAVDAGAYEGAASPSASLGLATNVTASAATLQGAVVPYAPSVDASFEVERLSDGSTQTVAAGTVGGTSATPVSARLTGLAEDAAYAYRLRADDGTRLTTSVRDTFRTLNATLGAPQAAVQFDVTGVGSSRTQGVTIENTGPVPVALNTATFSGEDASMFSTTLPTDSLDAGQTATFDVTFAPDSIGTQTATLTVEAVQDARVQVALSGDGEAPVLASSPSTVTLGRVAAGDTATAPVTLQNEGAVALTVDLSLSGPDTSAFRFGGDTTRTLSPGASATVDVQFAPQENRSYRAALGVTGPAVASVNTRDTLALEGRGLSVTPEVAQTPAPGDSAVVDVPLPDEFAPTDGTLFVRKGGASSFQQQPITVDASQGTAAGTIPGDLVTERGIDYYVRLTEGELAVTFPRVRPAQDPAHLRVRVPQTTADGAFPADTYRMLSVPLETEQPLDAVLEAQYGRYIPDQWRLLRWNASNGDYQEYQQISFEAGAKAAQAGSAFWLITRSGDPLQVENARSPDASAADTVQVAPGWTQIGTPFPFPVAWSDVANSAQVQAPVAYRPTEDGSDPWRYGQTVLRPWQGYFVYNPTGEAVDLVVPPVAADAAAPAAKRQTGPPLARQEGSEGYALRMTAALQRYGLRDARNVLGLRPDARKQRDRYDVAEAPPVGDHVRLSVTGRDVRYARSYKPLRGDGQHWDVRVTAQVQERFATKKTVQVTLDDRGTLPEGYRRYVLDLDARTAKPVKNGRFTVELSQRQPARDLRIILGTQEYARAHNDGIALRAYDYALRKSFPNPFRDATTIPYQLKKKQDVTITVYNVLGRRVRTLVSGERAAGPHQVQWKGRNDQGQPVASGVYFYRIRAGDFKASQKTVLVR